MKKILIGLMVLLSLSIVGCSNSNSNSETDVPKEATKVAPVVEIVKCNVKEVDGEFFTTEYKVKNISNKDITFEGLKMVELDKNGDILDSYYSYNQNAVSAKLKPDQSITFELTHEYGKIKQIEILGYEYTDSEGNAVENDIEPSVTFNIE